MESLYVRRFLFVSAVLALTVLLPSPRAQETQRPAQDALGPTAPRDFSQDVPAHLAFVEGEVTLERDGKLEPAERNLPLLAGDRLRTRGGRVEILYADGSTLAVDEDTAVDLLSDSLVRLLDGRVRVAILRTTDTLNYRIDSPAGSVEIQVAGEYRIQTGVDRAGDDDVDLTVIRGSAELTNDHGRTLVRAGRHAFTSTKTAPSLPYNVNSAAWDDFDRWVEDRRTSRLATASAVYLPEEVQTYSSALDDYGTWGTETSVGAVWYPRVADAWAPYSQGRWSYTGYYGWVWVGIDAWSWPTHHYGSWGYSNRWYWIPNHYWGPAWVSWAVSPGYVSWCPRGYDGRPVGGFPANGGYKYGEPWRTWTTLPAKQMAHNVWVPEHVVGRNAITPAMREGFVERPTPPMPVGTAVPRRAIAPLHAPTAPTAPAQPRSNVVPRGEGQVTGVSPFDAARSPRAGAAAQSRAPITYAVPAAPTTGADSTGQRATLRSVPNQTQASPAASTDRGQTSRTISPSRTSAAAVPDRQSPARAQPRQIDSPPPPMINGYDPARLVRRAEPDRSAPPSADPPSNRGRAIDRSAPPPSAQPQPPSAGVPARRAEPQAPPASTPPPSYSRGSSRPAPPASAPPPTTQAPPPSSAAPPSAARPSGRGGGGSVPSQGQAVPRRGGGGGGGR